jgi:hypothetical protein
MPIVDGVRSCCVVLFAAALLAAGCGEASRDHPDSHPYLVPRGDRHVLDDTYDAVLAAVERSQSDDPAYIPAGTTDGQRILYVTFIVDYEIANGGLYQVYWNLPGGLVAEAIRDAGRIGVGAWARNVRQAGRTLFPRGVPNDLSRQRELLGCPEYCDRGRVDTLNEQWRDGELRAPLLRFAERHPDDFYESAG